MIMPKKKRMLITAIVIAIVMVVIAIITCVVLYITTDLFKSNNHLFAKYANLTFSNINLLFNDDNMNEMQQVLQNNKYEVKSTTNINYKEGDNEENSINNLELVVNGKVEKSQDYDYQDISLKNKRDEKLYGIEYLKSGGRYGIRFNGIQQFATEKLSESNEKKEGSLLSELAITSKDENEINILKLISDMSIRNTKLELTEEENINLQNKYMGILLKSSTKDKITSKKNVDVTINNKKVNANSYTMTLTKEHLNDIHIEILTQLKQDNIILSKIEKIDNLIHQYNVMQNNRNKEISFKDEFIQDIDDKIENIQSTNIGNDVRKITVFESSMQPIGMQIETDEHTITITTFKEENSIIYGYLKQKNTEKENSVNFTAEKISNVNDDKIKIEYDLVKDDIKTTNSFVKSIKFDKDTAKTTFELLRKNEIAEIKITSQKEEKMVNEFKDKIEFDNKNSVAIDGMNQEQRNNINNIMKEVNGNQINKVLELVPEETINLILEKLELKMEEAEEILGEGFISETERNRFNSNFEFYEGNKISKENILKLIDITKHNLSDVRVTKYMEDKNSNKKDNVPEPQEYKLTIKRNNSNESLASNLATNIQNSKYKEYNVRIEYNQKSGLVESIFISVNK